MATKDIGEVIATHFDRVIEAAVLMERMRCIEIVRDHRTGMNAADVETIVRRIKKQD